MLRHFVVDGLPQIIQVTTAPVFGRFRCVRLGQSIREGEHPAPKSVSPSLPLTAPISA